MFVFLSFILRRLKIILSLTVCSVSEGNGMLRTVVIAGKAGEAFAVVLPLRVAFGVKYKVTSGTNFLAHSATYAGRFIYSKRLVVDQSAHEVGAYKSGVDAWPVADDQIVVDGASE